MRFHGLSCRLCVAVAVLIGSPMARADEADDLYDKAVQKTQWFDWEGSIPLLDRAIQLRPDFADAWHQRGLAYFNEKQYAQAIENFDQAVTLRPDDAASYLYRGNAHNFTGNLRKAIEDYTKVLTLQPDNADAYQRRGDAWLTMGDNARAAADLTDAIRLKPDSENAYRSRAFAYAANEQNDKAAADFAKVVEINPSESQDFHNLGVIRLRMGEHAEAIDAFTRGLRLNPQRDNSYYSRGTAYVEAGNLDAALTDFTKVIELNPTKADAWGHRALILLEKGRDDDARRDFARCFQLDPHAEAPYTKEIEEVLKRRKLMPEAAEESPDAPITPEEAIEQYEAAARKGDVERVADLYYEPMATPFRELYKAFTDVGNAKHRLAASLDKRFGRGSLTTLIPDDREIRELLKRTMSMTVRRKISDDQGYIVLVEIVEANSSGRGTSTREERFLAREQAGSWKVGPERDAETIRIAQVASEVVKKLPPIIDQITADVEAGKYVSRYDAEQELIRKTDPVIAEIK